MAAVKITVPSLVVSPITSAPVPAPEIMPPKVAVWPSAAANLLAPVLRAMVLVMVLVAVFNNVAPARVTPPDDKLLPLAPPEATDKVIPVAVIPPVKVFAPDNTMPPLLVASPKLNAPVPAAEIMPLKVAVLVVAAASLLAPALKVIALLMVLVVVFSKVAPAKVTPPVERWLPLSPPEATDKVIPVAEMPPVKVFAPDNTMPPLLVASPKLNAPVPAAEIMPLKVAVLVEAAASLLAPVLKVIALLMVLVALFNKVAPAKVTLPDERWLLLDPPEATDKVIPVTVKPPVKVLAPDNTMPPLLVALPKLSVPVPDPEIMPLKVTVSPVPAAIALAPALKVMALLMVTVLAGLTNKEPPPMVKAPDERWLLLAPPEATDKIPPLMVVPPV